MLKNATTGQGASDFRQAYSDGACAQGRCKQQQLWLQTLEAHDKALRRLADNHSDELQLLKQYRSTFQTRWRDSIREFVEFLKGYGVLLFKRRAQDRWLLPQFATRSVAPILRRDPDLRIMLRHRGLQAVAAAIRSSTIGAQAARYNGRLDHREIRYELLCNLQRADSVGREKVVEQVFSFLAAFNREAASSRWSSGQADSEQ